MTAAHPLDWIQEIETSLAELDEKPQFGIPTPLDWAKFEQELQQLIDPGLKITHTVKGWVDAQQVFAGFGSKLLPLSIDWTPLPSPALFVTDLHNMKELMALVFHKEEVASFFYESSYVQGFYNYFAAEMLRALDKQQFASPLTPRLGQTPEDVKKAVGDEACFVIDVAMVIAGKHLWGRVLLSETFRQKWKSYFAHLGPPRLSEELKQKVNIDLHLEVAHTRLSLKDWEKIKNGDFILLDHCSYDPIEHKGGVILTLNQKPVFRGRIKEDGIKITNYPMYEEVSDAMEDESNKRNFDTEDEDDDDLYSDFEDEDSEFDDDDDDDDEEDDIFAGLDPRKEVPQQKAENKPLSTPVHLTEEVGEVPSISPEELPIHLTVEVGRIRMTVGALMNLAPGNLLELNIAPEQGVDLVVNGKKVGRGELIRIGDVLGVRILSL